MPEFTLDTTGEVPAPLDTPHMDSLPERVEWRHLDGFTQGYIEALFFTEEESMNGEDSPGGYIEGRGYGVRFDDLAPETLAAIITDCAKFKYGSQGVPASGGGWHPWNEWTLRRHGNPDPRWFVTHDCPTEEQAGRDFWYTRNGHGCGFWDGDWPEPYATALTDASKAFKSVDVYLGDDGKVYLS